MPTHRSAFNDDPEAIPLRSPRPLAGRGPRYGSRSRSEPGRRAGQNEARLAAGAHPVLAHPRPPGGGEGDDGLARAAERADGPPPEVGAPQPLGPAQHAAPPERHEGQRPRPTPPDDRAA